MEFLFGGGTGCRQEDSNEGRKALTWKIHLWGLPGFRLVQVLLLAEQWRKFKPSGPKCKREGARPGQNPIAATGRHLCTPNLSVHPSLPSTGASLGHARSTRHRRVIVPAALPPPPLAPALRISSSQPPSFGQLSTRWHFGATENSPGDDTSPSPVPKCYFCRQ